MSKHTQKYPCIITDPFDGRPLLYDNGKYWKVVFDHPLDFALVAGPGRATTAPLIAAAPALLEALRECITEDGAVAWRNAKFAGQRLEAITQIAKTALARIEKEGV